MARSTFYYYRKRSNEPDKYASQKKDICSIFEKNKGRYGYRRITETIRNQGFVINHKTVYKLMKEYRIKIFSQK